MSVRVLALASLALAIAPRTAEADGPTSPAQVLASCKDAPDSALCREVRRLCATGEVRADMVPTCQQLGWYGDTQRSRLANLCPMDPTHEECLAMKRLCEENRAGEAGVEGAGICRSLGWGEYAYTQQPTGPGGESDAELGGIAGGVTTPEPRVMAGDVRGSRGPTLHPPVDGAGVVGIGFQLGLVDDPDAFADNSRSYGALISWTNVWFRGLPFAAAVDASVAGGSERGFVYDVSLLGGFGHWLPGRGAFGLVAGGSIEGVDGEDAVTPAVRVPVRGFLLAHLPWLTAAVHAQIGWQIAGEDRERESDRPAGLDAFAVGASLLLGRRSAANEPKSPRLWLGGSYEERGAARLFLLVIGFGAAQEPWNL